MFLAHSYNPSNRKAEARGQEARAVWVPYAVYGEAQLHRKTYQKELGTNRDIIKEVTSDRKQIQNTECQRILGDYKK